MELTPASFGRLIMYSVRDPRGAAQLLLNFGIPREFIWPAMLLVAVVSAILYTIHNFLAPPDPAAPALTPIGIAIFSVSSIIAISVMIQVIGRVFGGSGQFWDTLLLITFMQVVLIALQFVQTIVSLITTAFSGLFLILGLGLTIWLLVNFTAVVHGFSSLGKAFGVVVMAFLATGFVLAVMLGIAGVGGA